MKIEFMHVDELLPYENNPRKNEQAIPYLKKSIEKFGFQVPLVISKDNVIASGHTRLLAAKELGIEKVPCVIADDLSDEQIKAFRLVDNKVHEFSKWDDELLDEELMDLLSDFDMSEFGFKDLEAKLESTTDDINTESNFNYKEQYGVIVMCSDEQEQQAIYERLIEDGYECKVVAT